MIFHGKLIHFFLHFNISTMLLNMCFAISLLVQMTGNTGITRYAADILSNL